MRRRIARSLRRNDDASPLRKMSSGTMLCMLILHSDGGLRPPWGVVKTETPSAAGLAGFYLGGLGIDDFVRVGVEILLAVRLAARGHP